jgi:hypothetical protein
MPNFVTPKKNDGPSEDGEIVRPAFDDASGPHVSYNLPFDKAATKHVVGTFAADRVYILASGSLCRNTKFVQQLQDALGSRVAARGGGRVQACQSRSVDHDWGRKFDGRGEACCLGM